MNNKTRLLALLVIAVLWIGWYYVSNAEKNVDKANVTQMVSAETMKPHQPFEIDLSSTSYSEVTDPETITVNEVWITIENRLEVWSVLSDVPLDKPTGTFDTIERTKLSDLEWYTMIYSLPSLDTPVCTKQTKEIEYAWKNFESINFITLSHDMPFALERFCWENDINNVVTLSDARTKQFAQENWLYMNEFDLMTRAVVIINEQMEVLYIDYADEVTQDVDLLNAFAFLNNL